MVRKRVEEELVSKLKTTALELYSPEKEILGELSLEIPASSSFGDLSTNIALRLSKKAKLSPREVANAFCDKLKADIKNDEFLSKYVG